MLVEVPALEVAVTTMLLLPSASVSGALKLLLVWVVPLTAVPLSSTLTAVAGPPLRVPASVRLRLPTMRWPSVLDVTLMDTLLDVEQPARTRANPRREA